MMRGRLILTIVAYFLLLTPTPSALAQEIDFLWQGDEYAPAFYDGRSLWANQNRITIMAVPRIAGIANASSLDYKWTKNSVVLGTVSGIGRNSLSFSDSVLGKPVEVKLEILSNDGAILASKTETFTPINPGLLVYEDNPLYGILFNKEVGDSYILEGSEVTFAAFPLFFTLSDRLSPSARYSWRTDAAGSEARNSVTYRAPEGASGSSRVTVEVEQADRIMQAARKDFLVQFGQ